MTLFASKAIDYRALGIITLPVDRQTKRALISYADLSLLDITDNYIYKPELLNKKESTVILHLAKGQLRLQEFGMVI